MDDERAKRIRIEQRAPSETSAASALAAYGAELVERFGYVLDLYGDDDDLAPPHGVLLVATLDGDVVGCCGMHLIGPNVGEIKRLWTSPHIRGLGLGRRLLAAAEQRAADAGARRVVLDTRSVLVEAIALYRSAGYLEIAPYNDNPHAQHWFEKRLD